MSTKSLGFKVKIYYLCNIKSGLDGRILTNNTGIIMKFRTIAATLALATVSIFATAQSPKSPSAHQRAHQQQLAHQNRMDISTVNSMVTADIEAREAANALSPQSAGLIEDLLSEAKKYIGRPYVHGAKGPNAFDCSGYTSYIYKQFGYSISPGSRIQYTQGEPVSRKDLRKGDLVFFTSPRSGKAVGHVGIVWSVNAETGDFQFIHASVRGVKISDFKGYYVPRYVGAKRIIK